MKHFHYFVLLAVLSLGPVIAGEAEKGGNVGGIERLIHRFRFIPDCQPILPYCPGAEENQFKDLLSQDGKVPRHLRREFRDILHQCCAEIDSQRR